MSSRLKIAFEAGRAEALRQLAAPGLFGNLESRLVGEAPEVTQDPAVASQIAREQKGIQQRYGVRPLLTGSMPLGLNVPNDVDLDFFANVDDPDKFRALRQQLDTGDYYRPSLYNHANDAYAVYTAPAEATGGYPVDFAVAHGQDAAGYAKGVGERVRNAQALPDDLRASLVERKRVLKHTPFDVGHLRYKAFKRKLDAGLSGESGPVRLSRTTLPSMPAQKTARVLNTESPEDSEYLHQFLQGDDLYGHRTTNIDSVLNTGKVMSGLDALRRGHLKDYEYGYLPGMRSEFKVPSLTREQLDRLQGATLRETPDAHALGSLAKETGSDETSLKGALIRHRLQAVNKHLSTLGNAEDWRMNHLRIPKLSPNVFLTQGGLLADKGYGDVGFLTHTRKAQQSPYMTMIRNEAILAPKKGLEMQSLDAHKGLVVGAKDRISALEASHPEYTYVDESAIPKQHMMSSISTGELGKRVLPHLMDGTLRVRQG